jgi:pimeloyl-ACP methyl ester carboxylesterase
MGLLALCASFTPVLTSAAPVQDASLRENVAATVKLLKAQDLANCPPKPSGTTPLYRLYKDAGFDHFYTTKTADRDSAITQGYKYEGIVGSIFSAKAPGTSPLYKLYLVNGADHFYTTREADRLKAISQGYADEGIEGYVYTEGAPGGCWTTPFYRLYNGGLITNHFYTTDPVERFRTAARDGYSYEGIDGFLIADSEAIKVQKNPVLIVGGTYAAEMLYWILESRLDKDGYTYRFFELPSHGTLDINASADKLKETVDAFLRETGASKLHLIGHSQGGIVARTYIHRHAGQNTVESMISLASPHKGTKFVETDAAKLLGCPGAPPCEQMKVGSPLIQQINNRPPGDLIYYTNFVTNNDSFVTPLMNGTMDGCDRIGQGGETLSCNVHIQQSCPNRFIEHIGLAFDATVYNGIQQALVHQKIVLNCNAL